MKEFTRQKIEQEIEAGKLGIARDRLHGLMFTYPDDLSLRSRLGDVYWKLGYPVEAGRFWFLDTPLEGDKQAAVEAFTRSCRSDSGEILRRLKIRSELTGLDGEARDRLDHLMREGSGAMPSSHSFPSSRLASNVMSIGCVAIGISLLALALIGLIAVLSWLGLN